MKANQSNPRNRKSQIPWLVVPSLLFILVLAFDLLPFLRGNGEWRWPLRPAALTARILIPILVLCLYVFLCSRWLKAFRRDEPSPRDERWFMLFVIVAAPILQLSLASAVSRTPLLEFFGPTVSVHNSGYLTTAVSTPALGSLLANFPFHVSHFTALKGGAQLSTGIGRAGCMPEWAGSVTKPNSTNADNDIRYALAA